MLRYVLAARGGKREGGGLGLGSKLRYMLASPLDPSHGCNYQGSEWPHLKQRHSGLMIASVLNGGWQRWWPLDCGDGGRLMNLWQQQCLTTDIDAPAGNEEVA